MKKYYLIALVIIVLFLAVGYIRLFTKQVTFHETLDAETNVFVLENINNANIKIVTAKTDKITIDLEGPRKDVDKIRFFKKSGSSGFGLSEDWNELTGTITVPEGVLLDIKLSDSANLVVNDSDGIQNVSHVTNFLVDTSQTNSVNMSDINNDIYIDGWGDTIVWDTDNWDFFDGEGGGGGGGSERRTEDSDENDEYIPSVCSVGSQAIRNYCCERESQYEPVSPCSGIGQWVFNNSTRLCEYQCHIEDEEEGGIVDCSIGSQAIRNACCTQQNTGNVPPECIGEWQFNNVTRSCEFHCYDQEELDEHFGGGGVVEDDEDLLFCEGFPSQDEKDECCDYNLRNELSIGPRPGFPDCIGKWYFDQKQGCTFRCADYDEMLEILNELKSNTQE